jgi:hypothetical protein
VPVPTGDLVVSARTPSVANITIATAVSMPAVIAVEATLRAEPLGATTVTRAFGYQLSFAARSDLLAAA